MNIKHLFIITFFALFSYSLLGQINPIIDKVFTAKSNVNDTISNADTIKMELDKILEVLKFYREFKGKTQLLQGTATFGLTGNDANASNNHEINIGVGINNGVFPYEMDLGTNFRTTLTNGKFTENVSNIDISLDYHPISYERIIERRKNKLKRKEGKITREKDQKKIAKLEKKIENVRKKAKNNTVDALWLETFTFLKRSDNSFLGLNQRYEIGSGLIFNFYSSKKLIKEGREQRKLLDKLPYYEHRETPPKTMWEKILHLSSHKEKLKNLLKKNLPNQNTEIITFIDSTAAKKNNPIFYLNMPKKLNSSDSLVAKKFIKKFYGDSLELPKFVEMVSRSDSSFKKELDKLDSLIHTEGNLVKCLLDYCNRLNTSFNEKLSEKDLKLLQKSRHNYRNENIKNHSKLRIAFH